MDKKVGHCSDCGSFVWTSDVPVEQRFGKRVTVILADGSLMDLTLGDCCVANPDLDSIWQRVVAGWKNENAIDYSAKQMRGNCILAVFYSKKWTQVEL